MKNLVKKMLLCIPIILGFLQSCNDEENISFEDYSGKNITEIPDNYKKIMIEATELNGQIYTFNEDEAKSKGLPIEYIEKMKLDIENLNLSLYELRFEENNEIELVDPSSLDVDKLIKDYHEEIAQMKGNITGDLSTTNTSTKIKSFWNPNKVNCKFSYMQRVAMTATHTVGVKAQGDWKYKTRVAFLLGTNYTTTLTFDASNTQCSVSYRTGDGRGGFCGYTAY